MKYLNVNAYCKIILDILTMQRRKMVKSQFNDWLSNCNGKASNSPGLSISPILVRLEDMTVDELNYSICNFVTEAQHVDKAEHPPPKSLVLIQSCIYTPWDE